MEKVLIAGEWRDANRSGSFRAVNPNTGEALDLEYPVSSRRDVDDALIAGSEASRRLRTVDRESIALFLEGYGQRIAARGAEICATANLETALPISPRLAVIEMPRTTNQLQQAAAAARDRSWTVPTIDSGRNIRSMYGPLEGPVVIFGPNNFPLAFNGVSGGDFAAAIAAGNAVLAKAHPSHPRTSQLLAEAAFEAVEAAGLPTATVQMIFHMDYADGEYLVAHPLTGATGYTGSRAAGLRLKQAADHAGKPIYLEMSSVNPVFMLPGALEERSEELAEELAGSALLGTGQFCTNPGLVILPSGGHAEAFIDLIRAHFESTAVGALLGPGGVEGLGRSVQTLLEAGAELVLGGAEAEAPGCRFQNTLLRTTAARLLASPQALQTEAFGNCTLLVVADHGDQMVELAGVVEGSLTGTIFSHSGDQDEALYARIAARLRSRVGRLLDDKMPTGVAVVPSMNHGGPYPATGHPGFTAVGIPASLRRFAMLQCYDAVRAHRLPPELRDDNPFPRLWRLIDGQWELS